MRELTDRELNILMILADNKGHALWEITKLLGKEKSNLFPILNRLEEEIKLSDPLALSYRDIIDIESLEIKFHEPRDPFSLYIQGQLKTYTVQLLNSKYSHSEYSTYAVFNMDSVLDEKILDDLNSMLNDSCLFEEKRFEHIPLTEKIKEQIHNKPQGSDLRYLNRLLLEEGYPEEIAKCLNPIIYKGAARKTTNPDSRQPKHLEYPYFLTPNILVLEYIMRNLLRILPRPIIWPHNSEKYRELMKQVKSHQISMEEYHEARKKISEGSNYKQSDGEKKKKKRLLKKLLSSEYALQIIKNYGFKLIIYRIHNIVVLWNSCWTLVEKAIESGILSDEEDIRLAESLIQSHRQWEESIRQKEASKE